MKQLFYTFILLALLSLFGCQDEPPKNEAPQKAPAVEQSQAKAEQKPASREETTPLSSPTGTVALFDEPIEPVVLELPSEAIPYWRDAAADRKPALVLFSIHPLLQPIDDSLKADVATLVAEGTAGDLLEHGSMYRSEPLILPTQTVSAAIDANLFSEIIWVFPSTATPDQMQYDLFRKQVTEAGFLTKEEGDALNLNGGIYTGTVRGVPFRAAHPSVLPDINKPMILHVDLGYFKGLYQGEVKTRIYDILHETALLSTKPNGSRC